MLHFCFYRFVDEDIVKIYPYMSFCIYLFLLHEFFIHIYPTNQLQVQYRLSSLYTSKLMLSLNLIFLQVTRLNHASLGKSVTSQVVNLLSNDVSRFDATVMILHTVWVLPIFAIVNSYIFWCNMGMSILAGMFLMVLLSLPLNKLKHDFD